LGTVGAGLYKPRTISFVQLTGYSHLLELYVLLNFLIHTTVKELPAALHSDNKITQD